MCTRVILFWLTDRGLRSVGARSCQHSLSRLYNITCGRWHVNLLFWENLDVHIHHDVRGLQRRMQGLLLVRF